MSKEKKYTPAPWAFGRKGKRGYQFIDGGAWIDHTRVVVKVGGMDSSEGIANARLIAAAPDSIEANIAALDILERMGPPPIAKGGLCEEEDYHAAVRMLRSAIAKALGND